MAKHKGTANPLYAEAMRLLRQSNAAGTHKDRRERRKRTRDAKKRKEINDQKED